MTTSRRALPLFERIRIASPCDVPWDTMRGDEHVRHCDQCDRNVYDLSSLTRAEVERLFDGHAETPCVSYFQRADGTVLLADCPVGVARRRRWRPFTALAVATLAGVASLAACGKTGAPVIEAETRASAGDEAPCDADARPGAMRKPQVEDQAVGLTAPVTSGPSTPLMGKPSHLPRMAGAPLPRLTGKERPDATTRR